MLLDELNTDDACTEETELLQRWFRLDRNALPPVRVLQPISLQIPQFSQTKGEVSVVRRMSFLALIVFDSFKMDFGIADGIADVNEQKRLRGHWRETEEKLLRSLTAAAAKCDRLSEEQKLRWKISTTHQEVNLGALSDNVSSSNVLCYVRNITQFGDLQDVNNIDTGKKIVGRYLDLTLDGQHVDSESAALRHTMRQEVENKGVCCRTFPVDWKEEGILQTTHSEYITKFGEQVKRDLLDAIQKSVERIPKLNACLEEIATHFAFCWKRAEAFHGRQDLVQHGLDLVQNSGKRRELCVIHGISGSGKTSLTAKLALMCRDAFSNDTSGPLMVVRFCGTSSSSSSVLPLLSNITDHIEWFYSGKQPESPDGESFRTIVARFHKALQLATPSKPLLVFIDSLDQLDDQNQGRSNLSWLPYKLPQNISVTVSTLPDIGGCLRYLKTQTTVSETQYLEVTSMSVDDATVTLHDWFKASGRTLRDDQWEQLVAAATDATVEPPTMLRLKLLCDMAKTWRSYDQVETCPRSVRSLLQNLFHDLEKLHGETLVSHTFGLLALSKQGLGEADFLDLLSGSEVVLDTVLQYHKPPIRRLPQIVFARLRNAVGDYLVERGTSQGKLVLSWYHRQFREAAESRYLQNSKSTRYFAELLTDYYSEKMHRQFPDRGFVDQPLHFAATAQNAIISNKHIFNDSKILELPSACLKAGRFEDFAQHVCNLTFVAAAVESGLARSVVAALGESIHLHSISVVAPTKTDIELHNRLDSYALFLSTNMHIFQKEPQLIHQQATNMPDENVAHQDAVSLSPSQVRPWSSRHQALVTHINKPQGKNPCLFTMSVHDAPITDIAILAKHSDEMEPVVTACRAGLIVCYNIVTGSTVLSLNAGCGVSKLALTNPDLGGFRFDVVAACYDGWVRSWAISLEDGQSSSTPKLSWQAHELCEGCSSFNNVSMALSTSTQHLQVFTGACQLLAQKVLAGEIRKWDLGAEDRNGRPSLSCDKRDFSRVVPGTTKGRFGVSFLALTPQDELVIVAIRKSKPETQPQSGVIFICSFESLEPLCAVPDAMHQSQWIDIRPFLKWPPTLPDEQLWSMLVSTPCTQMRFVVSFIPQKKDVQSKLLWIQDTENDFHCAVHGKTQTFSFSGLGCNVELWEMPNVEHVAREKWKSWTVAEANPSLGTVDTFRGHGHTVHVVRVSEQAPHAFSGATNGVLKVWFLNNIRQYKYAPLHTYGVSACAVSGDGSVLVTGSDRGRLAGAEIVTWDPVTGKQLSTVHTNIQFKVTGLVFSPDKSRICYRTDGQNCVHILESNGACEVTIALGDETGEKVWGSNNLDWSPSGEVLLATSSETRFIWLVHVQKRKTSSLEVHSGIVRGGRFSSDGAQFVTWSSALRGSGTSFTNTSSEIKLFAFPSQRQVACYTAPPEHLVVLSDTDVEPVTGVTSAGFFPDGTSVAAVTTSGHIVVLAVPSLVPKRVVKAHSHTLNTLKIISHRKKPYIVTAYSKIRIWDGRSLQKVGVVHNGARVTCINGFSDAADNMFIQAGDTTGKLSVFKVGSF